MGKYLDMYNRLAESNSCPALCWTQEIMHDDSIFNSLRPTDQEILEHREEGYNRTYWGDREDKSDYSEFTPLRQNIVLFMAAMNDEL